MNSRQQKKQKTTTPMGTDTINVTEKIDAVESAAKDAETVVKQDKAPVSPEKEVKTAVKAETKKTAAPKATKAAPKTTKTEAKKELTPAIYVQYAGNEASIEDITEAAKKAYVEDGHRVSSIKSLNIYIKPEENAAYYVINEKFAGRTDLF